MFTAYLMGESFVGMRTADAQSWADYLQSDKLTGSKPAELRAIAIGKAAIPALHAAALKPDAFAHLALRQMIPSWESIVAATETFNQPVNVAHGALQHYDLYDVTALLGGKVSNAEAVDAMGKRLP